MKKKVLIPAAISLMAAIVLYGAGVFITWEVNPKNWDDLGRTMYVIFLTAIMFAAIVASYTFED